MPGSIRRSNSEDVVLKYGMTGVPDTVPFTLYCEIEKTDEGSFPDQPITRMRVEFGSSILADAGVVVTTGVVVVDGIGVVVVVVGSGVLVSLLAAVVVGKGVADVVDVLPAEVVCAGVLLVSLLAAVVVGTGVLAGAVVDVQLPAVVVSAGVLLVVVGAAVAVGAAVVVDNVCCTSDEIRRYGIVKKKFRVTVMVFEAEAHALDCPIAAVLNPATFSGEAVSLPRCIEVGDMRNPRHSIMKSGESCPSFGFLTSNVNEYMMAGGVFLRN
jgi:hypothetical protein